VLVDPHGADWERYTGASMITPNRAQVAHVTGNARAAVPLANRAGGIAVGQFGTAPIAHAELTS
jgi:D-glycero-beta-D-manno-heptose-7-phosphate kinase